MVESAVAPERAYIRSPQVISSETSDETVALHIGSGDCYAFAGPSARIWALLDQPLGANALCDRLVREFDIAAETCLAEVSAYLAKLESEGLVRPADAQG